MDSEETRIRITLESRDYEALKQGIRRIVGIVRSRGGVSLQCDVLPVDGSNGRGVYRKTIAVFSPSEDLVKALGQLELPEAVIYTIEV